MKLTKTQREEHPMGEFIQELLDRVSDSRVLVMSCAWKQTADDANPIQSLELMLLGSKISVVIERRR
jgi:hypothetical protein